MQEVASVETMDLLENSTLLMQYQNFSPPFSLSFNKTFLSDYMDTPPKIGAVLWEHSLTGWGVASIVLYAIVFVLALVGNMLVIITLVWNRRMQTVTNCFLLSLSVSDLLMALICMPVSITGQVLKRFVFGLTMCKIIPYLMGISVSVSTLTMLSISIERFQAICNPLTSRVWLTRTHAKQVVIVIWLLCLVLMSPLAALNNLHVIPIDENQTYTYACRIVFDSRRARKIWYLFLLLSLFVLPGIIMAVAYAKVCWTIVKRFRLHKDKNYDVKAENSKSGPVESSRSDGDGIFLPITRRAQRVGNSLREIVRNASSLRNNKRAAQQQSCKLDSRPVNCCTQSYVCSRRYPGGEERWQEAVARWRAKKRVVQMFIVIMILYFVCWTPLYIINVWRAFDPDGAMAALEDSIQIIHLLSYVSTCVNPVVYCFMNKRFRESFISAFLCCATKSRRMRFNQDKWPKRGVRTVTARGSNRLYEQQGRKPTPAPSRRVSASKATLP